MVLVLSGTRIVRVVSVGNRQNVSGMHHQVFYSAEQVEVLEMPLDAMISGLCLWVGVVLGERADRADPNEALTVRPGLYIVLLSFVSIMHVTAV